MRPDLSTGPPTRRAALLAAVAAAASLAGCTTPVPQRSPARPSVLRLIGEARIPFAKQFKGTTVGGLSGLDYDPVDDLWYALSDDGSGANPARMYTLKISVRTDTISAPQLMDVVTLRRPDGTPFRGVPQGVIGPDPEAIRFNPGSRTLLWTSEGDIRRGEDPFVREMTQDGRHLREFILPAMLKAGADPAKGPRHNLGLEGLALTAGGAGAWAAMEAPLQQDGPVPGVGRPGGPCRFTLFDTATGHPVRQLAYMPDAIPRAPALPGGYADNGVSEILMIDAHRMLVLERAYMAGIGNSLRVYEIDTRHGSDTLAQDTLIAGGFSPSAKIPVLDFAASGLMQLDNTEAMAWGPLLPGGGRSLVFLSDDNFNPGQITQFAAFEYQEQTS